MKLKKIEVGMTVYIRPVGINNTRRRDVSILDSVKEDKISKIGRKYFYLEGSDDKYNIDNLRHDSNHHYDMQSYLDRQDILDEIEFNELQIKIKSIFSSYGATNLTLEQLRKINEIVSGK